MGDEKENMIPQHVKDRIDAQLERAYPEANGRKAFRDAYRYGLDMGAEIALESQWISVSDSMPETGQNVLCCAVGVTHVGEGPQLLRGFYYYAGDTWWHDEGVGPATYEISHWSPLPTPPQP